MTCQVKDALEIDISGGEQDNDMRVWRHMIDTQVVNIVQPDVCYMGGISRTLEVAKLAQKANLPVTLHSANLSLVTLFSAHIMGSIPNAGKYLEFSIEGLTTTLGRTIYLLQILRLLTGIFKCLTRLVGV